MKMLAKDYFNEFKNLVNFDLDECISNLQEPQNGGFEFLLEASAVYSSNIEGNTMDVNSFMNFKSLGTPKPKEFKEIADLKEAYDFARTNKLTEDNLLITHKILSRLIVSPGNSGVYRQDKIGVFSSRGLEYMAVEHDKVAGEMQKLFETITSIKSEDLLTAEALYLASTAHLNFAHIHPFTDGNGRVARLLEKWLLSEFIGERAWLIESEKFYKEHLQEYYANIALGVNYYELDYSKSIPFLQMLTRALQKSSHHAK